MNPAYDNYIISAIATVETHCNASLHAQEDFGKLKKKLCKKFGVSMPTNADLRDRYNQLLAKRKIKKSVAFENILRTRGVRTQSGVAVVAVLTKSYPCPGDCLYCPTEKDMPKSYLSNEPAVMRAIDAKFDPYRQVQNRLRSLELNGHATDKIELIVMGGTFSYLPKAYQKKFITRCFQAANEYHQASPFGKGGLKGDLKNKLSLSNPSQPPFSKGRGLLNEELIYQQKKNETAEHRIIGLTLETRPDYIDEKEILNFRELGCTRVELGVQSLFDDVLKLNRRGHLIQSTIQATKMLKDAGFKINYHMMPGLPGSTPKRDFEMFKALFEDSPPRVDKRSPRVEAGRFQPDMLKIYPTVVLKDSDLYNLWKSGRYIPLSDKQFEKLVLKIKNEAITPYVRIARLVRDVPTPSIVAGPIVSNLRQIIEHKSSCPCIRCREVKGEYISEEKIVLDRIDYNASDGKEIFLQYVSPDKKKLFALLRLRISDNNKNNFIPVLKNAALIREVHTYGKLTKIDAKDSTSPQHIGLGRKLLLEAERIAKEEYGLDKIVVISGVGVRGYYRKNGYRSKDTYMFKNL